MNTIFLRKSVSCLPGLAAIAVLGGGLPALAQTVDTASSQPLTEPSATVASVSTEQFSAQTQTNVTEVQQFPSASVYETASSIVTPVPGTVATSSTALSPEYTKPTSETSAPEAAQEVAQADIDVGRPTRGGRSYLGVAGNIGLSGDGNSSLGDGNFAVISKIGLTNTFSIRPSAVFGDSTTILIPVSYDFSLQSADPFSEPLAIAPYVGVGAAIKTGDDSEAAVLVSGGIDLPLSPQFTATAAVNAGFFDQTDVGLLLGVGYNFTGF